MLTPVRALIAAAALIFAGPTAGPPPTPAKPPLWVVRDADTTIYLFGTIHWLKGGIGWFDEAVADAFRRSDTLVLEMVAPDPAAVAETQRRLATIETGPPLPDRLPPEARPRLAAAIRELGYPEGAFDRTEPWLVATTLSVLPLKRHGYDAEYGVEPVLTAAARDAGKPVLGLEARERQLGYFDRLPEPAQIAMLLRALDNMDRAAESNDAILAAWTAGDVPRLAAIVDADQQRTPGAFRETIVRQRNARWAEWVKKRLETPGTVFLAVGVGHLAGSDTLQRELAKRGVRVERVAY